MRLLHSFLSGQNENCVCTKHYVFIYLYLHKRGALQGLPFIFATAAGLIFSHWINISLLKVQEKNNCASLLFVT